eukprot:m.50129 g.50129  ORF g.50129 m.50129 type:complete len:341 (-) comp12880_c0_seq1:196-1218(-)
MAAYPGGAGLPYGYGPPSNNYGGYYPPYNPPMPQSPTQNQHMPNYLFGGAPTGGMTPQAPASGAGLRRSNSLHGVSSPPGGSGVAGGAGAGRAGAGGGAASTFGTPAAGAANKHILRARQADVPSARKFSGEPPCLGLYDEQLPSVAMNDHIEMSPTPLPFSSPAPLHGGTTLLTAPGTGLSSTSPGDGVGGHERCVTVFGFSSGDASFVLTEFEQYGAIRRRKHDAHGNWMHLEYATKAQAHKALSKNGKTFGQRVMVGVRPCDDPDFLRDAEGEVDESSVGILGSPAPRRVPRQLTASRPAAAVGAGAGTPIHGGSGSNVPKKNDGYLSLLREYVLGW